jgi:hypothetical protein
LNNREKAVIVDALKEKYPLPVLIKKLKLAKSSYYYQNKRVSFAKKHKDDIKLLRPYSTTIRKDMDIVELK